MARPEKWKDEYLRIAEHAAKLGATDRDIAEMLDVSERTLHYWKHTQEGYADALKVGKDLADDRVEQSLYRRAVGYTFDGEKVFQHQGEIVRAATVEHVAPDTTAAIFWLKNRKREEWRDRQEVDHSGGVTMVMQNLDDKL